MYDSKYPREKSYVPFGTDSRTQQVAKLVWKFWLILKKMKYQGRSTTSLA
jgi:hypothetical protein